MVMDWASWSHRWCWPIPAATATPMQQSWRFFGALGHRLTSAGPCLGRNRQTLLPLLSVSFIDAENLVTLLPGVFVNRNGDGPADASKFVLHFMTWCQPQCLVGAWSSTRWWGWKITAFWHWQTACFYHFAKWHLFPSPDLQSMIDT